MTWIIDTTSKRPAKLAADGIAVFDGKHHIKNQKVVGVHCREVKCFLPIACNIDGVGLLSQALGHEGRHSRLIFNQQNPHCSFAGAPSGLTLNSVVFPPAVLILAS